jgi:hypothetical protein
MNTRLLLGCALGFFATSGARAALVPLGIATGTFDQGAPFNIASTLDGTPVDTDSGWGVFGGQGVNQAAMWTTSGAASATNGFIFSLPQNYVNDSHHIQRFRLSLTTDAAPSLGGNWSTLSLSSLLGSGGVTFTDLGSNIIAASGGNMVTYQAVVPGNFSGVTAFRLEVFPETNGNGQLGAAGNGNFVLSQFRVDTMDAGFNWAALKQVTPSGPVYFNQEFGGPGFANYLTDDSLSTINHPATAAPTPFSYTVDLGGFVDLTSVQIFNRADCCPERLSNFRVNVLDVNQVSVWQGDFHTDNSNSGFGGIDTITEGMGSGAFEGRFIRITGLAGTAYSPQIAEVKAFGTLVPEPSSLLLAVFAGGAMLVRRRR